MKNIFGLCFLFILAGCLSYKPGLSKKESKGKIGLVVTPVVGDKPLFLDSVYESPAGVKYSVKSLRFFMSNIALSRSTGKEYPGVSESGEEVFFLDFNKSKHEGYGKQISFNVASGEYSDIRFVLGVPRELNHSDPSGAAGPLNIAQAAEMYWEWNSGYIFFLAEGKIIGQENRLFHFAIGHDSRIMPFSFGNLFEVTPLITVENGKTTRIEFELDFNKLLVNGDQSFYSLDSSNQLVVHGGYQADMLRNNLLRSLKFKSSKIMD